MSTAGAPKNELWVAEAALLAVHHRYYERWNHAFQTGDTEAATRFIHPKFVGYFGSAELAKAQRSEAEEYKAGNAQAMNALGPAAAWNIEDRSITMRNADEGIITYAARLAHPAYPEVELLLEVWRRDSDGEFKLLRCYEEVGSPNVSAEDAARVSAEVRGAIEAYFAQWNGAYKSKSIDGITRYIADDLECYLLTDELPLRRAQFFSKASYKFTVNFLLRTDITGGWQVDEVAVSPRNANEAVVAYLAILTQPARRVVYHARIVENWCRQPQGWAIKRSYQEIHMVR